MAKKENVTNGAEEVKQACEFTASGRDVDAALEEFGAACDAVKAKKKTLYEKFLELDKKRNGEGLERMTISSEDPFDLDAVERAAQETGSPQEIKEWIALIRALVMPVYRDSEFMGACLEVLSKCSAQLSCEDKKLREQIAELERERNMVELEYGKKIKAAEKALYELRDRVHKMISGRATEADHYLLDCLPSSLRGVISFRDMGLVFGQDVPVETQMQSFLKFAEVRSRPMEGGDIYAHLKKLHGEYVPGVHQDLTVVGQKTYETGYRRKVRR